MRYVHIENPGPHNRLIIENGPKPECSKSQILVHVKATALNRADIMQRYGKYPPPPGETEVLGLEVAGEVVAVGTNVTQFKLGDKVYGLVGSGAYAEYCPVEASLAQHIPDTWNYTLAAALPESLTTVYATLFDLGKLKSGQTLLIHGAGSGISSLAIQMAKLSHAHVITTVGSDDKVAKASKLGADQVINYRKQDFEDLIEDHSVDLIVDFVGGDYFDKHLHLLKPKSKLIQIACLKGSRVECNLALIMRKRLQIIGFVLRSQSLEEKIKLWDEVHKTWIEDLRAKKLTPIIDSEFKLEQIEGAHQHMQSGAHFGKIVVHVD
ncbi:quinone oxidoreductase [Legionella qingyii]|uniref:Quinone oxidoreductase n=1 Tax=Legionella qingyii TaxID=2184757 RepID=A0A317U2D4_9GAMM|nr:NAD(P)H-quinone oxidoreductase [Legionella qingyii]PWY56204.1 quinone oxidoreductase [Legionella qingyii]RUR22232.1 NAD(P)H-quinone oxidoreductase [Legionella qingyii]RUR25776.1 NAD(P)H-quinone oxidoreductase [Legionella qingyii]